MSKSFEEWKAEAETYSLKTYCLPAGEIEDHWFDGSYKAGETPKQSVDSFAQKYDLEPLGISPWGTLA